MKQMSRFASDLLFFRIICFISEDYRRLCVYTLLFLTKFCSLLQYYFLNLPKRNIIGLKNYQILLNNP